MKSLGSEKLHVDFRLCGVGGSAPLTLALFKDHLYYPLKRKIPLDKSDLRV